MADAEQIFNDCTLDLLIPNGVLLLPSQEGSASAADDWLHQVEDAGERQQAFFDEKLEFFLMIRFHQAIYSSLLSPDVFAPPPILLSFLNHLQVSLDATYIPSTPIEQPPNVRIPAPPARSSSSLQAPSAKGLNIPLPIFPPQTPSPKPSTSKTDQKYVYAEGTPLKSFIWGEDSSEEADSFRILRSTDERCWIAIYRICLSVVYVRTDFENPLLCLTTSITLRDKPLSPPPQRRSLLDLIEAAGPLPSLADAAEDVIVKDVVVPTIIEPDAPKRLERGFLDEINLLEGLSCDGLAKSEEAEKLYLLTSRLGSSARQAYSLPPLSPISPNDTTHNPSRALPVLRKSFRKTLGLASGFHVRMRTILVPQLFLPQESGGEQAANDESTVVLSIEIENPGDSESAFSVDAVEVTIKNEDTRVRLIGWGDEGFKDPSKVFPLFIRPAEQYYLMYAVAFLRSPEVGLSRSGEQEEYKKMVSFNIIGRPFTAPGLDYTTMDALSKISYLTSPFMSRWNCRLDLDPRRQESLPPPDTFSDGGRNAIPVPPSPFPVSSPRTQRAQEHAASHGTGHTNTTIGPKRHTYSGTTPSLHLLTSQRPISLNTSPLGTPGTSWIPSPLGKLGMRPWTVGTPPSTTSAHLSPPLPPLPSNSGAQKNRSPPPTETASNFSQTPAFPSYGSRPLTPRPNSVTPSLGQMGTVGMEMDAKREKTHLPGMPVIPAPPMTPRPQLGVDERPLPAPFRTASDASLDAKDFVVSVSLVPPKVSDDGNEISSISRKLRLIRPLDEFSLEIFVFNQSPYIRRLEATLADKRRRRGDQAHDLRRVSSSDLDVWKPAAPAYIALESKVQIGPLGPSTCQSVTMRFLAVLPGVHTIDGLVLTDLDIGESISLRSVMDFAVLPRNLDSYDI